MAFKVFADTALGIKITGLNIYLEFYVIKINPRVQVTIDIAEFTPKELFFVI